MVHLCWIDDWPARARFRSARAMAHELRRVLRMYSPLRDWHSKLATQVREAVVEVAKAESIDVIIGDGVVYSSKRVDISDKVIAKMEEQFKASGK